MKTMITILLMFTVWNAAHATTDDKYIEVMKKNIDSLGNAKSVEGFQRWANAFERIATVEKSQWEPYYYASFGYIMMSTLEKEGTKKDLYLDQAMAAVAKAKELAPSESEVIALEGFAYMMRLVVDPQTRGQQYGALAMQSFGAAVGLNPENPRAIILMAQMQYGSAQFFKASTAEACANVDKALLKFESYTSENPLAPRWGKQMAEGLKRACQ